MKYDLRISLIIAALIAIGLMILFIKVVIFFAIVVTAISVAVLAGFFRPIKYIGVELITISTILIGAGYGPVIGAIYGFIMIIMHLGLGQYYIGQYVIWLVPEYALLGIVAGMLKFDMYGFTGLSVITGMNILNLLLTAAADSERFINHLPYAIGNIIFNSILILWIFKPVLGIIV